MKLTIETGQNGWIVKESDESFERLYCFSYDSVAGCDVEAFSDLLCHLTETLGMGGSRYDAKRIYISVKTGDKNEDFTCLED